MSARYESDPTFSQRVGEVAETHPKMPMATVAITGALGIGASLLLGYEFGFIGLGVGVATTASAEAVVGSLIIGPTKN